MRLSNTFENASTKLNFFIKINQMNAIITDKIIYPKKIRFFGSTKCSNMLIKKSINCNPLLV